MSTIPINIHIDAMQATNCREALEIMQNAQKSLENQYDRDRDRIHATQDKYVREMAMCECERRYMRDSAKITNKFVRTMLRTVQGEVIHALIDAVK